MIMCTRSSMPESNLDVNLDVCFVKWFITIIKLLRSSEDLTFLRLYLYTIAEDSRWNAPKISWSAPKRYPELSLTSAACMQAHLTRWTWFIRSHNATNVDYSPDIISKLCSGWHRNCLRRAWLHDHRCLSRPRHQWEWWLIRICNVWKWHQHWWWYKRGALELPR